MKQPLTLSLRLLISTFSLIFLPFFCFADTPVKPVNNKPVNINVAKKYANADSVTLVEDLTEITLDTLRSNTINKYTVKLKFKLKNYSHSHKDTTKVILNLKPILALSNLNLITDTKDVIISKADWGTSTDAIITKSIDVLVEQTQLVNSTQEILISPASALFTGKHLLRFLPFAGKKAKSTTAELVKSGSVEIVQDKAYEITRDYNSLVNPTDSLIVKLSLHGKYQPAHNQIVFSFLDTSLNKHFQILENPIVISENEWQNAAKNAKKHGKSAKDTISKHTDTTIAIPIHLKNLIKNDSIANNIQKMDLIIKGQTQAIRGSQRIKLNMPDKPFWAEIGTNFDLLDNLKTNNFYAGVYMFDKDIARLWAKKSGNNISFTGGVYESQSVSIRSTNNIFDYKDGASEILDTTTGNVKSYKTYRDTGSISSTTSIKRIGLFISPMFRITSGKTDANGLHLFIAPYFEMLWQRISATVDYSKANKTYTITSDTGKLANLKFANLPYKTQSFNFDFRSHYLGLGVPLYIKENDFNLYFNPVIGATTQGFAIVTDSVKAGRYLNINNSTIGYDNLLNIKKPSKGWHGFYMFQFRLNEVAYGITFSGEIRGITIHDSQPVITLAISKKFDLAGLFKPILSTYK